jgi:hypothetical protein
MREVANFVIGYLIVLDVLQVAVFMEKNNEGGAKGQDKQDIPDQEESAAPGETTDGNRCRKQCQKAQNCCKPPSNSWTKFSAISQTAVGGALIFVGFSQFSVYDKQAEIMGSANKLNAEINRPFVYVADTMASYFANGPEAAVNVQPIWSNSGSTPTVDLIIYRSWKAFVGSMPENYSFPDLDALGQEIENPPSLFRNLLPPKGLLHAADLVLNTEQMNAVNNRDTNLYEWGWARYHDPFDAGKIHITRFCVRLVKFIPPTIQQLTSAPAGAAGALQWAFCEQGNCADDECKKQ